VRCAMFDLLFGFMFWSVSKTAGGRMKFGDVKG
jgi:hypothetical protein